VAARRSNVKTRLAAVVGVAGALCLLSGCSGPKMGDPSAAELKAALNGLSLTFSEDSSEEIAADNVSDLQIAQIIHNPKDSVSSALVHFKYASGDSTYQVEGVITYTWSDTQKVISPQFESSEVTAL
jgi:hypothetical protein